MVPNARATLRREVALLPALRSALPLPTPRFEYAPYEGDQPLFVGYRHLPGSPLTLDALNALPAATQERTLHSLAEFLDALHAYPLTLARAAGVREERCTGGYHPAQRRLPAELAHLLTRSERGRLDEVFTRFESKHRFRTAVVHADLKPEHVMADPRTGQVTGVLDWGDVAVGDPDFDLAVISIFFGPEFQQRLLAHLPSRDPTVIAAKTRFYETLRWLQDLAYVDSRGDDPASTLDRLRHHLDVRVS
jgi:aminoglycoside 2''-phosphotransferase